MAAIIVITVVAAVLPAILATVVTVIVAVFAATVVAVVVIAASVVAGHRRHGDGRCDRQGQDRKDAIGAFHAMPRVDGGWDAPRMARRT